MNEICVRNFHGIEIGQRAADGRLDATAMCHANAKRWNHYASLDGTKEFIQALSESTGIPADSLVESRSGRGGGTYVHPDVAIHLAQWCSPRFAVQASKWVRELSTADGIRAGLRLAATVRARGEEPKKVSDPRYKEVGLYPETDLARYFGDLT